jgi:HAD superfamily hydrolase (TIGR01549 family)
MSSKTRCALFDFADTLAELQPKPQNIVGDYIESVSGIRVDTDVIIRSNRAVELLMQYSSVRIRSMEQRAEFYREYNRNLFAMLGISHMADPDGLYTAFGERKAHWQLKLGVRDILDELRRRGYFIGIISNFDTRLKKLVYDHLGLASMVDYLHISQIEGVEKPDPRFYLSFFKKYDVAIKSSFYVGDSYVLDFLPANAMGLKTWLLDEAGIYPYCPDSITSLSELLQRIP